MAKKNRKYGARFTALLGILFIVLFSVLWALFISGPNRIQEENQEQMIAQIEKNNPDIQGLTIHQFDYLTAQGYTETRSRPGISARWIIKELVISHRKIMESKQKA